MENIANKMRNKWLFAGIFAFLSLCSCEIFPLSSITESSSLSSSNESVRDYKDERDFSYANKLEQPSSIVHNIYDLEALLDYNAFYKNESFSATLANDYVYSSKGKNITSELNYLYWTNELVNGVMGMNATEENNTWNFDLKFYRNAYVETINTNVSYQQVIPGYIKSANNLFVFSTDSLDKPLCDVYSTQQLWYAAEKDYRINPITNSPAEKYYLKAKEFINKYVSMDMSEYQKYEAIYDSVISSALYDYAAIEDERETEELYPDEYAATYKAYFIEGFFDNGRVVCDGFAKITTLLCKMVGIDCVRAIGVNTKYSDYSTRSVSGHAYNYVNINNKWYISDLTWGQNVNKTKNIVYSTHDYLLGGKNLHKEYIINSPITDLIEENVKSYDVYFNNSAFSISDNNYSRIIDFIDEKDLKINYILSSLTNGFNISTELAFTSEKLKDDFESLVNSKKNLNVELEVRSFGETSKGELVYVFIMHQAK